jgi:hypothetical protein
MLLDIDDGMVSVMLLDMEVTLLVIKLVLIVLGIELELPFLMVH